MLGNTWKVSPKYQESVFSNHYGHQVINFPKLSGKVRKWTFSNLVDTLLQPFFFLLTNPKFILVIIM